MTLDQYVIENKKVIELVKNKNQNDAILGKYYGTLDYATACLLYTSPSPRDRG